MTDRSDAGQAPGEPSGEADQSCALIRTPMALAPRDAKPSAEVTPVGGARSDICPSSLLVIRLGLAQSAHARKAH
jgi:hypothetical protein